MVGVFDGISFGALYLGDVDLKWALVCSVRVRVTENGGPGAQWLECLTEFSLVR
jgi:hypothetical protein